MLPPGAPCWPRGLASGTESYWTANGRKESGREGREGGRREGRKSLPSAGAVRMGQCLCVGSGKWCVISDQPVRGDRAGKRGSLQAEHRLTAETTVHGAPKGHVVQRGGLNVRPPPPGLLNALGSLPPWGYKALCVRAWSSVPRLSPPHPQTPVSPSLPLRSLPWPFLHLRLPALVSHLPRDFHSKPLSWSELTFLRRPACGRSPPPGRASPCGQGLHASAPLVCPQWLTRKKVS